MTLRQFVLKKLIQSFLLMFFAILIVTYFILNRSYDQKNKSLEEFLNIQSTSFASEISFAIQKREFESAELILRFLEANHRDKDLSIQVLPKSGMTIGEIRTSAYDFRKIYFLKETPLRWGVEELGTIKVQASEKIDIQNLLIFPAALFSLLLLGQFVSFFVIFSGLKGKVSNPISEIVEFFSRTPDTKGLEPLQDNRVRREIREISELEQTLNKYVLSTESANQKAIASERKAAELTAYKNISRQVAHDIRSPIGALRIALTYQNIELAEKALLRMQNIAEDLLLKARTDKVGTNMFFEVMPAIQEIVDEKSIGMKQLNIQVDFDELPALVQVDRTEFQRIVSNLVQNSMEAVEDSNFPSISISAKTQRDQVKIVIQDNGSGIPEEILQKIGQEGFSYRKKEGNGLGVHHAKGKIVAWGGSFSITSQVGLGTSVTFSLPQHAANQSSDTLTS